MKNKKFICGFETFDERKNIILKMEKKKFTFLEKIWKLKLSILTIILI